MYARTINATLWLQALTGATGGAVAVADVVDCTVFLPIGTSVNAAKVVQNAVKQATSNNGTVAPAALTVVELGLGAGNPLPGAADAAAKVRCTALEGGASSKKVYTAPPSDAGSAAPGAGLATTVAGGFAYVSGAVGAEDGTDAFNSIEASLVAAGSRMVC